MSAFGKQISKGSKSRTMRTRQPLTKKVKGAIAQQKLLHEEKKGDPEPVEEVGCEVPAESQQAFDYAKETMRECVKFSEEAHERADAHKARAERLGLDTDRGKMAALSAAKAAEAAALVDAELEKARMVMETLLKKINDEEEEQSACEETGFARDAAEAAPLPDASAVEAVKAPQVPLSPDAPALAPMPLSPDAPALPPMPLSPDAPALAPTPLSPDAPALPPTLTPLSPDTPVFATP